MSRSSGMAGVIGSVAIGGLMMGLINLLPAATAGALVAAILILALGGGLYELSKPLRLRVQNVVSGPVHWERLMRPETSFVPACAAIVILCLAVVGTFPIGFYTLVRLIVTGAS